MSCGGGFGRFTAAAGSATNLFFLKKYTNCKYFFVVGSHRLNEIINGDGLVTGLEELLELAFGVGLFGQLFCKGQPLSVGLANPKAGGIVPSI